MRHQKRGVRLADLYGESTGVRDIQERSPLWKSKYSPDSRVNPGNNFRISTKDPANLTARSRMLL